LDATIGFAGLSPEIVGRVVDKFIGDLEGQLADQGVTIDLSDEARERLAIKGYDSQNGARPLARVIQEDIKRPLADELLFGRLAKGGRVTVGVSDGAFTFIFADGPPSKKKRKTPDELEPVK
jgi:ATP-dependent Clp protease ATP-binding subunit ClpA